MGSERAVLGSFEPHYGVRGISGSYIPILGSGMAVLGSFWGRFWGRTDAVGDADGGGAAEQSHPAVPRTPHGGTPKLMGQMGQLGQLRWDRFRPTFGLLKANNVRGLRLQPL